MFVDNDDNNNNNNAHIVVVLAACLLYGFRGLFEAFGHKLVSQ